MNTFFLCWKEYRWISYKEATCESIVRLWTYTQNFHTYMYNTKEK